MWLQLQRQYLLATIFSFDSTIPAILDRHSKGYHLLLRRTISVMDIVDHVSLGIGPHRDRYRLQLHRPTGHLARHAGEDLRRSRMLYPALRILGPGTEGRCPPLIRTATEFLDGIPHIPQRKGFG